MTTHPHDNVPDLAPPPGCPAHSMGPSGVHRLYGAAEADPRALHEELRRKHGPVAPVLLHGDLPAWLVLGYRENLEVMRSAKRFSRNSSLWRMFQEGRVAADSPLLPTIAWQPVCVFADGAEHQRLRGAVTDSLDKFNKRSVRRYTTRYTEQLIDDFAADGRADLISQFAERLPMLVMSKVLGMPEEYGHQLVTAVLDLMRGSETALQSNEQLVETLTSLVARRQEEPEYDLPSWLLAHESRLTEDEVIEHLRLILVAANETTVNLMANTLRMVLTDRRFRASLSGGQMTLPDALDQVLWDAPPMSVVPGRVATGDIMLGGQQIEEGDLLLLGLAAGNVDPDTRPDLSTPLHGNRSHLAFSSGPHECPGQDMGRAIADGAIDTLLTRLPDLQLAVTEDQLRMRNTWLTQRQEILPVTFTPRRGARGASAVPETGTSLTLPAATVPPPPQGAGEARAASGAERTPWWKQLFARTR